MKSRARGAFLLLAAMVLVNYGCSGSSDGGDDGGSGSDGGNSYEVDLSGAVQKGPFVIGSSVQISVLDADLAPTGQVFNTETSNDRGEFEISFESAGPVKLEGVGYYYNEITGQLSGSNLTLRALYSPSTSGEQEAYINMITHLTVKRIETLVADGSSFDEAVSQAENELHTELAITYPGYSPTAEGVEMNMVGEDNLDNAYVLGVSSLFIQLAARREGSLEANLQEVLNAATIDLSDGVFEESLKQEITGALLHIDVDTVTRQLNGRLSQIGSEGSAPNMHAVLDQDRDGIVNMSDNCRVTVNPGQENSNGSDFGDACSPTWISIPQGTFMMGCVPQDTNCNGNEIPQHEVNVPAFWMAETEVTREQYHNVMGNYSSHFDCGRNCPISENWTNARAFCDAIGARLATEAEWEYAARAGTTTIYLCGDDSACMNSIAWYEENSGSTIHEVKGKDPNPFGLYDMEGNYSEWVEDSDHADYSGAPSDGSAWVENPDDPFRVIRGGSFNTWDVNFMRASKRSSGFNGGGGSAGFRCAKSN